MSASVCVCVDGGLCVGRTENLSRICEGSTAYMYCTRLWQRYLHIMSTGLITFMLFLISEQIKNKMSMAKKRSKQRH